MIACIEERIGSSVEVVQVLVYDYVYRREDGSSVEVVHILVYDSLYRREDGVIGRSGARIGL